MSKKKNTLKDLDEFLKQQAATLVSPATLSDKVKTKDVRAEKPVTETPAETTSFDQIAADLKNRVGDRDFDENFYKLIIRTIELKPSPSPEDRMLINTALYLLHGENWKEAIRSYWKEHQ